MRENQRKFIQKRGTIQLRERDFIEITHILGVVFQPTT